MSSLQLPRPPQGRAAQHQPAARGGRQSDRAATTAPSGDQPPPAGARCRWREGKPWETGRGSGLEPQRGHPSPNPIRFSCPFSTEAARAQQRPLSPWRTSVEKRGLAGPHPRAAPGRSPPWGLTAPTPCPLPPPPAAEGGAADREAAAEGWGFHPGSALGMCSHPNSHLQVSRRRTAPRSCQNRQNYHNPPFPGLASTAWVHSGPGRPHARPDRPVLCPIGRRKTLGAGTSLSLHQRSVSFLSSCDGRVRLIAKDGVEPPGGMAGREAIVQLLGLRSCSHIFRARLTEGTRVRGPVHRCRQA